MTPAKQLDINYGATQDEKDYVKETLNTEGVKALFAKELTNLKSKIIRNFHTDNYVAFEVKKTFDTEKQSMRDIINKDADMKAKYEAALAAGKGKGGFSEGILLLQTIAVKCVNIINTSESVENKLTSRNEVAYKSKALDGVMGPNTFYVLASIAKEKGISFNGEVDATLLSQMISICGETPIVDDKKNEVVKNDGVVKKDEVVKNDGVVKKEEVKEKSTTDMSYSTTKLEEGIAKNEEELFTNKEKKNREKTRIFVIMAVNFSYDELFTKFTSEEKTKKIKEITTKRDTYTKDGYEYRYYDAVVNNLTEKMSKEVTDALENYTLNMTNTTTSEKITSYTLQKENGKNKVTTMDPVGPDGTKYKIMVINGQRSPIPELKGALIDKTIFEIRIKEDGKTLAQNEYTSSQTGEAGNKYTIKDNTDNIIDMTQTTTSQNNTAPQIMN